MDWGTLITRRASREPVDKNGWSVFFTVFIGPDMLNPALGPAARVALELTEETALALAEAIHRALDCAPAGLASKNQ